MHNLIRLLFNTSKSWYSQIFYKLSGLYIKSAIHDFFIRASHPDNNGFIEFFITVQKGHYDVWKMFMENAEDWNPFRIKNQRHFLSAAACSSMLLGLLGGGEGIGLKM